MQRNRKPVMSKRFKMRFKGKTSLMTKDGINHLVRQQSLPIDKGASPESTPER